MDGDRPINVKRVGEAKLLDDDLSVKTVATADFGTLYAPEDLTQLAAVIERLCSIHRSVEGWRGQPDIKWKVDSSAVRRIRQFALRSNKPLESKVEAYEQKLLNSARLRGFGLINGRETSDLETLAFLRHYGAATRLLDFSRNVFIALWFACHSHTDEYGIVLGFDTTHEMEKWISLQDHKEVHKKIKSLLSKTQGQLLIWEPMHLFERIRTQQSLFLLGKSYDGPWGSLVADVFNETSDPTNQSRSFFAFAVSPVLKLFLRDQWKTLLGYDVMMIFPDIEGFSRYHSANHDFDEDYSEAIQEAATS